MFRSAVERAGLDFAVDCPPLDEPVYIDRDMWEKVVLNLLSNALKFTFDGTIADRACAARTSERWSPSPTPESVCAAEEMPRLFERFHRIENVRARSNEGSGIGLALVKELVDLHGGSITADSTEGAGHHLHASACRSAPRICPPTHVSPADASPGIIRGCRTVCAGGVALVARRGP